MDTRETAKIGVIPFFARRDCNALARQPIDEIGKAIDAQVEHESFILGEIIRVSPEGGKDDGTTFDHPRPFVRLDVSGCRAARPNVQMFAVPRTQKVGIASAEEETADANYCHSGASSGFSMEKQ
jgi:hypothetical protein